MPTTVSAPPAGSPTPDTGTWRVRTTPFGDRLARTAVRALVLFGVVFLLAPLVVIVVTSFNVAPALAFPPRNWSLSSYGHISASLYEAFLVSVQLAVVATLVSMALAVPAAFALVRGRIPGARVLETFLRGPLQVPQIIMGLALYEFMVVLDGFGVPLQARFAGLVVAHVVLVTPYILATAVSRVAAIDRETEEAAAGLGARPAVVLFRVVMPAIRQALIASGLLAFLVSFDNVPLSLFLTVPGGTTLPVELFNQSESSLSPTIYAAASATVLFSLVFTAVLDRLVGLRNALRR